MGPTNIVEASGPPLPASIRDWTYIPEAKIRCTWCWIEQVCRLHWEYLSRKFSLGSNLLVHLQRRQWLVHSFHNQASGRWKLPLYVLIGLLYREALLTVVDIRLVSDRKLRRVQRKKYREMQAKLFVHWDEYQQGKKSALQLLRSCWY